MGAVMKVNAVFRAENGGLVRISDGKDIQLGDIRTVSAEGLPELTFSDFIVRLEIPLSSVELDGGLYNEEFLAGLRDFLKKLESRGQFAVLAPVDNACGGDAGRITELCSHTARRVKDCLSVVGVEIPRGVIAAGDVSAFADEISRKHQHYVYFSGSADMGMIPENFPLVRY